jgi:hypothetical protein
MPGLWGLLQTGFKRKRFLEIRDSMYSAIRQLWAPDVDLSDDSPTAIRAQVAALEDDLQWKAQEGVFFASFIPTASGVALDYLGQWLGQPRFTEAAATGAVAFTGDEGTVIPAGTRVFAADGTAYLLVQDIVIPASGIADSYVVAEKPGAKGNKVAGTIVSSESGDTVSNARQQQQYILVPGGGSQYINIPAGNEPTTYQRVSADTVYFLTDIDGFEFTVKNPSSSERRYALHIELWTDSNPTLIARTQTKILTLPGDASMKVTFDGQLINATSLRGGYMRVVFINEEKSDGEIALLTSSPSAEPQGFWLNGVRQNYNWDLVIISRLIGDMRGGRDTETDLEYRERLRKSIFRPARATPGAIVSRLQGVFDIRHVLFDENVWEWPERGLRPKSVELVVAGGFIPEIAANLADVVAAGIAMNGTDIYPVLFNQFGYVRPVAFVRPTPVPIQVWVELQRGHDFPADGVEFLKDQIIAYIGGEDSQGTMRPGLRPGAPVVLNEIVDRVMDVPGVRDAKVLLAHEGNPPQVGNISLAAREIAQTSVDLIIVS